MSRRFFHGRVVLTSRAPLALLCLALCFLFGALLGNGAAKLDSVSSNPELQAYLASFLSVLQQDAQNGASMGYTLFSYCKYPVLVYMLGFMSVGLFLIPVVSFYQGFAVSFAVSAFIYAVPEHGLILAFLLFGFRCFVVLPCFFLLADDAMCTCAVLVSRRRGKGKENACSKYGMLRFAFCMIFLIAGALLEYVFLPELLCMVV